MLPCGPFFPDLLLARTRGGEIFGRDHYCAATRLFGDNFSSPLLLTQSFVKCQAYWPKNVSHSPSSRNTPKLLWRLTNRFFNEKHPGFLKPRWGSVKLRCFQNVWKYLTANAWLLENVSEIVKLAMWRWWRFILFSFFFFSREESLLSNIWRIPGESFR